MDTVMSIDELKEKLKEYERDRDRKSAQSKVRFDK